MVNCHRHSLLLFLLPLLGVLFGIGAMIAGQQGAHASNPAYPPPAKGIVHRASGFERFYDPAIWSGSAPVQSQSVIGTDDRVRIKNTSIYPWRAIAWIGIFDGYDLIGSCTGTFIGPDALLTAGHCLYDQTDGWAVDVVVVPGKDGTFDPYGHEFADSWWVPDGWIDSSGNPLFDWGVIRMPSKSLGNLVGWFRIANLNSATLSDPNFMPAIVGYPGEKGDTMWGSIAQRFLEVDDFELFYDIDTTHGDSGSAVFSANVDSPHLGDIVGVHVRGLAEANAASRMDAGLMGDILEGCRQMGCTVAWYTEPATQPAPTPTKTSTPTPTPTQTASRTPTPTPARTASPTPARTTRPSPAATTPPGRAFRAVLPLLSRE